MTGIAGVIANDTARYTLFWSCWDDLQLPDNWRKERLIGGDWCGARNTLCEYTLKTGADYLWFMDDDHSFAPDLLLRLLRWEKDLTTPICLMRSKPFAPVSFDGNVEEGDPPIRHRINMHQHEAEGLVQLTAGGTAGMLIHRRVLEEIAPPWFEYSFVSEDLLFCDKAMKAGFELYCDLSARLGHITTAVVEPAYYQGEWTTGVQIGSYGQMASVMLPIMEEEQVTA